MRAASDVFVLQDGTPLVSKPEVGGKILLWVDTGFPLTVVGREGDWLKVSGARLEAGSDTLWVPAARVGRHLPGTLDIAYSEVEPFAAPEGPALLLEVIGTQEIRVRARCRIVQPGDDDFIDVVDETPVELDIGGPTADCTVRKLGDSGTIDVALRMADGQPVATATTYTPHGAVRVRTMGPWGGASGFRLPTRFVFLKEMPDNPFPPGNPVPPPAMRRRRLAIPCRRSSNRRCRHRSGACTKIRVNHRSRLAFEAARAYRVGKNNSASKVRGFGGQRSRR